MSSIKDAVAFYDSHYENIGNWYLSPEKKFTEIVTTASMTGGGLKVQQFQ